MYSHRWARHTESDSCLWLFSFNIYSLFVCIFHSFWSNCFWRVKQDGGGHGNPLQYSCLEKPMDRGAWWATVLRVTAQLKCLSRHAWRPVVRTRHFHCIFTVPALFLHCKGTTFPLWLIPILWRNASQLCKYCFSANLHSLCYLFMKIEEK